LNAEPETRNLLNIFNAFNNQEKVLCQYRLYNFTTSMSRQAYLNPAAGRPLRDGAYLFLTG